MKSVDAFNTDHTKFSALTGLEATLLGRQTETGRLLVFEHTMYVE